MPVMTLKRSDIYNKHTYIVYSSRNYAFYSSSYMHASWINIITMSGLWSLNPFVWEQKDMPIVQYYGNMTWELVLCTFFTIVVVKFLRDSWFKKTIPLDGKVIFITGCDTGFGNALARKLDSLGCVVFAGCLSSSGKGAKVLQEETSPRLKVLDLDTSDDKSVEKARDFVKNYLNSSDSELWALVNNAGIMVKAQIEICSMEIFHKIAEVNLFGTIRVTKAFLPFVRHAKGRVVNMSSVHGRYSSPTYACYGLSKHGIENFSDVLRMEISGFGVKVSIIEPGRFGAATAIFSGDALATRLTALDDMWSKADEEIKTVYKSRYEELRRQQSAKPSGNTSSQSMEPVLNAMVDAIENVSPKHRYLLGGNAFDDHCFLALVSQVLPSSIMDRLTLYITGQS